MLPRHRGDRGGVPYAQPRRYVPPPGEVVRVCDHNVFIVRSFVDKMNDWYDTAVNFARPGDPARTGRRATSYDLIPIVEGCFYAPFDSHGIAIDSERIAFRHADFPGYLFVAVLEGITEWQARGNLTFISMVNECKPAAERKVQMWPMPVPDWPPPECPKAEGVTRLERSKVALDVWIKACPNRHPKLDEAYSIRRAVIGEMDRLLRLPDEDLYGLADHDADEIFDLEEEK